MLGGLLSSILGGGGGAPSTPTSSATGKTGDTGPVVFGNVSIGGGDNRKSGGIGVGAGLSSVGGVNLWIVGGVLAVIGVVAFVVFYNRR